MTLTEAIHLIERELECGGVVVLHRHDSGVFVAELSDSPEAREQVKDAFSDVGIGWYGRDMSVSDAIVNAVEAMAESDVTE